MAQCRKKKNGEEKRRDGVQAEEGEEGESEEKAVSRVFAQFIMESKMH